MTTRWEEQDKIVALCERIDIALLIDNYTKHLRKQGVEVPKFRIINIKELTNLQDYLNKIEKSEGFENIAKILLFIDAGAKRRETEHLLFKVKKNSFLQNFNYDLYMFPKKSDAGNWTPGFMEDLLLPALKHDTSEVCDFYNLRNIAHEFIFTVHNCRGRESHFINYSRNFLYSYFSGTEKYVGLRLGEAVAKGAFDLEDEGFKDLREFLQDLQLLK